jgi:hypothetical protein
MYNFDKTVELKRKSQKKNYFKERFSKCFFLMNGSNLFVWPQVESFEYLRMSIDDVLRLDEDIESQDYPGNTSSVKILVV